MHVKTKNILNLIVLILLLFATMNFYAKFFYFVFAAIIFICVLQRKIVINTISLVYLALGLLMAVYNSDEGILSMLRCFAYFFMYLVGYNIIMVNKHDKKLKNGIQGIAFTLLMVIALGSFLHYILNFIYNIGVGGGRNTNDIWTGQIMAATGQAALASIMLGFSVAMILLPKKKVFRYLGFICLLGIVIYNFILAGRTLFFILAILLVIGFLFILITSKRKALIGKYILGFLAILTIIAILIMFNVGGIRDYILDSNFFNRFDSNSSTSFWESQRINIKISYLANAYKYPFGGLNLRNEFNYAHDLLLDGYDEYGIFGLILLVAILITGIMSLYKILKNNVINKSLKLSLLSVYGAVLLIFCVEPILAGMSWLFACFCLINGLMSAINKVEKNQRT